VRVLCAPKTAPHPLLPASALRAADGKSRTKSTTKIKVKVKVKVKIKVKVKVKRHRASGPSGGTSGAPIPTAHGSP